MSASECGQGATKRGEIGLQSALVSLKSPSCENACINSGCDGCCADGMDVSTYTAVEGVGP